MYNRKNDDSVPIFICCAALAAILYFAAAWIAFQWRNPKSNEMSFWRHLPSVLTFEKLDEYQ